MGIWELTSISRFFGQRRRLFVGHKGGRGGIYQKRHCTRLFVRGQHSLGILYESGFVPKCIGHHSLNFCTDTRCTCTLQGKKNKEWKQIRRGTRVNRAILEGWLWCLFEIESPGPLLVVNCQCLTVNYQLLAVDHQRLTVVPQPLIGHRKPPTVAGQPAR